MLYLVIEHFRGNPGAVYERLRKRGRLVPSGLRYVNSWVTADLQRCYQVMDCDSDAAMQEWIDQWNDLVDFEVIAVMPSADAAAAFAPT